MISTYICTLHTILAVPTSALPYKSCSRFQNWLFSMRRFAPLHSRVWCAGACTCVLTHVRALFHLHTILAVPTSALPYKSRSRFQNWLFSTCSFAPLTTKFWSAKKREKFKNTPRYTKHHFRGKAAITPFVSLSWESRSPLTSLFICGLFLASGKKYKKRNVNKH